MERKGEDIEMVAEPKEGEKQFRDNITYYAIGPRIVTSEVSMFKSNPVAKKIGKNDIEKELRNISTVKIFDSEKEARSYAKFTTLMPLSHDPGMSAIILEVQPKKIINLSIEQAKELTRVSNFSLEQQQTKEFKYAIANVNDLTFISGEVLGKKVDLSAQEPGEDKNCTVM
ncbi:Uncharacterised protein [Legionella busanensis]|uniref:Uncharacterized protein n=1 Tax=Legionella busanensis TaxID=190655 RepID=A0A378JJK7_9GAMM|nr:hypothetical protein [Legionella busanensis]STX50878.1 Uncharacterised protein [Legionella busanensis]